MSRVSIVSEILDERERQDKKWGEQNHKDLASRTKKGAVMRYPIDIAHAAGFRVGLAVGFILGVVGMMAAAGIVFLWVSP